MLGPFHPSASILLRLRPVGGGRHQDAPGLLLRAVNGVLHLSLSGAAAMTEAAVLDKAGAVLLTWDGHRFGGDALLADLLTQTREMLQRGATIEETATEVPRPSAESAGSTQNTTL